MISDIATAERIPRKFLETILVDCLKIAGILQNTPGKNGGYALAKKSSPAVGNIIRLIDGPLAPVSCVSHLYFRRCDECLTEEICQIRLLMKKVRDATAAILNKTYLSDLQKINAILSEENSLSGLTQN